MSELDICQQTLKYPFGQDVYFPVQCKSHKTRPTACSRQVGAFAIVFVPNHLGLYTCETMKNKLTSLK